MFYFSCKLLWKCFVNFNRQQHRVLGQRIPNLFFIKTRLILPIYFALELIKDFLFKWKNHVIRNLSDFLGPIFQDYIYWKYFQKDILAVTAIFTAGILCYFNPFMRNVHTGCGRSYFTTASIICLFWATSYILVYSFVSVLPYVHTNSLLIHYACYPISFAFNMSYELDLAMHPQKSNIAQIY